MFQKSKFKDICLSLMFIHSILLPKTLRSSSLI